jgi:hypothetical protein
MLRACLTYCMAPVLAPGHCLQRSIEQPDTASFKDLNMPCSQLAALVNNTNPVSWLLPGWWLPADPDAHEGEAALH